MMMRAETVHRFAEAVSRLLRFAANEPGWSTSFSPETLAAGLRGDGSQTIPMATVWETLRIWNFDTYIDDPESSWRFTWLTAWRSSTIRSR